MKSDYIIIRFSGEIGIKGKWTRRTYEKQVLQNLKHTLKNQNLKPISIEQLRGRIYLETETPKETSQALTKVFGISSVSPAKKTTSDIKILTEAALKVVESAIQNNVTFAVKCHRVGTQPYSSIEVCRIIGEKVLDEFQNRNLKVNLTNPQITLTVEVRDQEAYIYAQTLQGAGGFPLGTQARTVCLLSGGMDSPVACWLTMKRGCPPILMYVDNWPFTDEIEKEKAIRNAKKLKDWSSGYIRKMYIIPNGENMKLIQQKTPARFTCLLCKRLMYRIAQRIAENEKAYGIVTGEAIGEQASQTMHNLFAIDEAATNYPIHRPLLGFDKIETEAMAKKIGTLETTTIKSTGCSAVPSMPSTQAKLSAIKEAEENLEITTMVENAIKAAEIIEV